MGRRGRRGRRSPRYGCVCVCVCVCGREGIGQERWIETDTFWLHVSTFRFVLHSGLGLRSIMEYISRKRGSTAAAAVLAFLVASSVSMAAAQEVGDPWFYHGLEGPAFAEKNASGIDVRAYPGTLWTATTVTGKNLDKAMSEAFMRLFRYISGENEEEQKIPMTVPVLTTVTPGAGPFCEENFTIHFYVPKEFQDNPPKPLDPRVENIVLPPVTVAVASYPGWSDEKEVVSNGKALFEALRSANIPFESETFFTAGYDSPFRLIDRHNEVWVKLNS